MLFCQFDCVCAVGDTGWRLGRRETVRAGAEAERQSSRVVLGKTGTPSQKQGAERKEEMRVCSSGIMRCLSDADHAVTTQWTVSCSCRKHPCANGADLVASTLMCPCSDAKGFKLSKIKLL